MGQQIDSQVVAANGVNAFINKLANQWDDVLDVCITEHGQVLIIFKPQGTYQPPQPPYVPAGT